VSNDALRELSPESELESIDSLSDFEESGTADMPDIEDMLDADMGMTGLEDTTPRFDSGANQPFTPTTIDLDTSLYSSAFDYTLIDNDANFALNLTPPVDINGAMTDGLPWDAPTSNPLDGNTGHLGLLPSLIDLKQGDGCTRRQSDSGTPEPGLRRARSKTTLVLEDVDSATLCKVIGILAEAKTKISMQSGESDCPKY